MFEYIFKNRMGILRTKTSKKYLFLYAFIFLLLCLVHIFKLLQTETAFDVPNGKSYFVEETKYEEVLEYDTLENSPDEREKILDEYMNTTKYPLFQPTTEEEFPTIQNGTPRIPHIIHQIWNNITIPDNFIFSMRSFVEHNPTWKYMFWTYDSGRRLIAERHPYLLKMYDDVGNLVQKSDILRFIVVYEFGGVYADLDVKNVRPLHIATWRYSCILSTETFEHSAMLNDMPMFMTTAVILCRQKHPFFKLLLHYLQFENPKEYAVISTGPGFLTRMYMKYNKLEMSDLYLTKQNDTTNSPFFYKGTRDLEDENSIYVPNTQYFMDTIDPLIINEIGDLNDCVNGHELTYLAKRGCAEYEHRRGIRKRRKFAFTVHYWVHMWIMSKDKMQDFRTMHVKEIIPNCTLY